MCPYMKTIKRVGLIADACREWPWVSFSRPFEVYLWNHAFENPSFNWKVVEHQLISQESALWSVFMGGRFHNLLPAWFLHSTLPTPALFTRPLGCIFKNHTHFLHSPAWGHVVLKQLIENGAFHKFCKAKVEGEKEITTAVPFIFES